MKDPTFKRRVYQIYIKQWTMAGVIILQATNHAVTLRHGYTLRL
jgi:hypothetical protein